MSVATRGDVSAARGIVVVVSGHFGERTNMPLTPHHVGIIVSDLEASTAFYEALGFETVSSRPSDDKTIQFMRLAELEIELFCYLETPPALRSEGKTLGFRHLALRSNDVDAEVARLVELGRVPPSTEIREIPGMARLAFFDDPDGLEIEIMQPL